MQVKTTIGLIGFVLFLVPCARVEAGVSSVGFTTGTSVENLTNGVFDVALDDFGGESGSNHWVRAGALNAAVTNYTDVSPAYDYAAKGTKRNALFDAEPIPSKGRPGTNNKYLTMDTDGALYRTIMPVNIETNICVSAYPDVYADTLVKFSVSLSSPGVTGVGTPTCDKVIVWLRETELAQDRTKTNLVVTAGRYAGDFGTVVAQDYVTTNEVSADVWMRLTIRAIGDVTDSGDGKLGCKAPGYAIYVDGKPVAADETYDIGLATIAAAKTLAGEARVLVQERRLFPSLARASQDESATLSRLAFSGRGAVDDTALSTQAPDFAASRNVFTLAWDAGVVGMKCVVSNDLGAVTNTIDATVAPFFRDHALQPDVETHIVVTDVVYDEALAFKPGQWSAKDCELEDNVFTCDGAAKNPGGTVASTREVIEVGTGVGQYATFAEAKLAATGDVKTIVLGEDIAATAGALLVSSNPKSGVPDDIILDLDGHTLRGPGGNSFTIGQTDGSLKIIDSSEAKTGRVLPPEGREIAVQSTSSGRLKPKIVLTAGSYDGLVLIVGGKGTAYTGTCIVEGGSYTNSPGKADSFYLESYVTNPATYFARDAREYWSVVATDAAIWSGKGGADDYWTTADNWRNGEVPGAEATVIFPRKSGGGAWSVNFNVEAQPKKFWMDADVAMSGTNDFTDVTVLSGEGRFVGAGTAVFTGKLPGRLTDSARADGGIRLGANWAGTVKIAGVTRATPLNDIMYWGTARSKVLFNGVRGYVADRASYALPYGLVLTDDGTTPAWLNETGYTGSTVSFPTLEGTGTFVSPLNTREILQVFQFRDVTRFTGGFNLGGKRLVLGNGKALNTAKAGSFTFSEGVRVQSALAWTGVNAHFGKTLEVSGKTGEALMAYTGETKPDVGNVVVTLYDRESGAMTTNYLIAAEGKITIVTREEWEIEHGGGVLPLDYNFSIDFQIDSGAGKAVITVEKPVAGCWYGVQRVTSLAEDWNTNNILEWKHITPSDAVVTFEVDTTQSASGFYRVIATGKEPVQAAP